MLRTLDLWRWWWCQSGDGGEFGYLAVLVELPQYLAITSCGPAPLTITGTPVEVEVVINKWWTRPEMVLVVVHNLVDGILGANGGSGGGGGGVVSMGHLMVAVVEVLVLTTKRQRHWRIWKRWIFNYSIDLLINI